MERVEIHSFPRGSWQPAKIEEVHPGFDSSSVESYLLAKNGAGRYRFSAIVGQKTFAWRVYTLGDVRDDVPTNGNGHGDATAVTGDEALRQISRHLQANLTAQQLSGMVADLETARTNRELAPVKALTDLVSAVIGNMGKQPPQSDRLTDLLIAELKDLKQELRDVRTAATAAPSSSAGAPAPAARLAEDIKAVMSAAELLGMRPGGRKVDEPSVWTPDAVKSAIESAGPLLNRLADVVQLRLAPQAPLPAPAAALPPGGTTVKNEQGALTLDPQIQEQVTLFLEALRSRDWPTVQWCLHFMFVTPDGTPLVMVDPDVNPLAYVMKFRPFAPKIDELRGEVADFLKWVREQQPRPMTSAPGGPAA